MKRFLLLILVVLILAGGGYLAYALLKEEKPADQTYSATDQPNGQSEPTPTSSAADETTASLNFEQPKKSAHYVSNNPAHAAVLTTTPQEVSIRFNFDLSTESTISVIKDGQEVSTGQAAVSSDKLTLSKSLLSGAGPGVYTVKYSACWPDGSCHDGQFQFGVQ